MNALLREFGILVTIAFMALPFTFAGWCLLANQRRRRKPARTAALTAGADMTITVIATLAFFLVAVPIPGAAGRTLHLTPGTDIETAVSGSGSGWQIAGNLLLLTPLGALLPLRLPAARSVLRVTATAFGVSLLVEVMQYVIDAGRVSSADDVLLNTIGATFGASLTRRWWSRLRAPRAVPVIPAQLRRTIGGHHLPHATRARVIWPGGRCTHCGVTRPNRGAHLAHRRLPAFNRA